MRSYTRSLRLLMVLLAAWVLCSPAWSQGGRETLGAASWSAPQGWSREAGSSGVSYNLVNRSSGAWCVLGVYSTTNSRGSIAADFDAEWDQLVRKKHGAEGPLEVRDGTGPGGAELKTGVGRFSFKGAPAVAMLSTYRLGAVELSVLVLSNDPSQFEAALDTFERSLRISPSAGLARAGGGTSQVAPSARARAGLTPTTFDNGWTSVAEADWVRASKGDVTVLMHYPSADDSRYFPQTTEETQHFWNKLLASRHPSPRDFKVGYNSGFEAVRFATCTETDPQTGLERYVVLFKKKGTYWMEFLAPGKAAFVQAFGMDLDAVGPFETEWQRLTQVATYNRFGVTASDLVGTWTSDFSGLTQYVSAQTGNSVGTDTHTSRETFAFGPGATYRWDLGVATGMVGSISFQTVHSSGTFGVPSCWKVSFSDIERKPKTYNASFSAVRGGTILWLDGTPFGRKK